MFERLRRQLSPPFLLSVDKTTSPKRLTITVTFDGNLEREYSVGEDVTIQIDDVLIIDKRIPRPVICKGVIHHGILGAILCATQEPVRWPKDLAVDDWFFLDTAGNRSKERARHWNELRVPSGLRGLTEAEDRLGVKLPADFRRYMEEQKSLSVSRATLFHADEIYLVEAAGTGKQLLAFGLAHDGSPYVFNVDESARTAESPVFLLDKETTQLERQAESFAEWVKAHG